MKILTLALLASLSASVHAFASDGTSSESVRRGFSMSAGGGGGHSGGHSGGHFGGGHKSGGYSIKVTAGGPHGGVHVNNGHHKVYHRPTYRPNYRPSGKHVVVGHCCSSGWNVGWNGTYHNGTQKVIVPVYVSSNPSEAPNSETVVIDNVAYPVCSSSRVDPDGDSWGWEDNVSCKVIYPNCSSPAVDPDGDGWGWEYNTSCLVQ